jgi:signal transduction histidine kinase
MRIQKIAKGYGHHILFGLSILSLAALLAWWTIFIGQSIRTEKEQRYRIIELEVTTLCLTVGREADFVPEEGICDHDPRFEILKQQPDGAPFVRSLAPGWPGFWVKPRAEVIDRIEQEYGSKNAMLLGESGFLILILLVSSIFLYRSIQQERRTAREIKEFWERTAHEIKTPITGIKAFLQNLRSQKEYGEIAPYVDLALKQVDRQEKLAENILSGYRLKSSESLSMQPVNLPGFLDEYFKKSSLSLTDTQLTIDAEVEETLLVHADVQALKVILDNLTDNAIKYAGPQLELRVGLYPAGKDAVVEVRDNGPGFPPARSEDLFHAFEILEGELKAQRRGAGMGLYISRSLAREMGGDLKASNGDKGGAVFRLSLKKE